MFKKSLYFLMELIGYYHAKIMNLNNGFAHAFTDKQLHFLVMGAIGMVILLLVYPAVKYLVEKKAVFLLSGLYALTCIIVLTFAIEIGQKITKSGNMEFADIMFGVAGFLAMFLVSGFLRLMIRFLPRGTGLMKAETAAVPEARYQRAAAAGNAEAFRDPAPAAESSTAEA